MDDSTRTMMLTMATGVIKKGLFGLGVWAATHGVISSSQVESFVGAGMLLVGVAWSFWNDYGKAIVLSKLEVLKAQSLAQAAKMRQAGVAPPSAAEIAAQHPSLTPADVVKQAVIVKVLVAAVVLSFLAFPGLAMAQTPKSRVGAAPVLTGDPVKDIKSAIEKQETKIQTDVSNVLQKFSDFLTGDMTSAADLAISIAGTIDGNGQQCFDAMAAAGQVFKAHPLPADTSQGIASAVERLRLLAMTVNKVCQLPSCTQVFADASGALSQLSLIKSPVPNLHDLCASVPTVAVAAATRTLPAPAAQSPAPSASPSPAAQ